MTRSRWRLRPASRNTTWCASKWTHNVFSAGTHQGDPQGKGARWFPVTLSADWSRCPEFRPILVEGRPSAGDPGEAHPPSGRANAHPAPSSSSAAQRAESAPNVSEETVMRETLLPVDLLGKLTDDAVVDPTSAVHSDLDCWTAQRVDLGHLNGLRDQWWPCHIVVCHAIRMCRSTSDSLCVPMPARHDSLFTPPWPPVFRMPLRMDLVVNPARSAFPKARSAFLCATRTPTARESDLDVKQPGGRTRNLAAGHPAASRNGAASRAGSTAHHAAQRLPGRCVSTAFHPIRAEGAGWGFLGLPFTAKVHGLPPHSFHTVHGSAHIFLSHISVA